jgi:hypothetical protein
MESRADVYFKYEGTEVPKTGKKDVEVWRDAFKDKYLTEFCVKLEELLIAMETVFHECEITKDMHNNLDKYAKNSALVRRRIINTWHEKLCTLYPRIKDKDETVLKDLKNFDLFLKLKIAEKWKDEGFHAESKESFWLFIIYLNWLANGYNFFSEF